MSTCHHPEVHIQQLAVDLLSFLPIGRQQTAVVDSNQHFIFLPTINEFHIRPQQTAVDLLSFQPDAADDHN